MRVKLGQMQRSVEFQSWVAGACWDCNFVTLSVPDSLFEETKCVVQLLELVLRDTKLNTT